MNQNENYDNHFDRNAGLKINYGKEETGNAGD
jgi:hypothetical protein